MISKLNPFQLINKYDLNDIIVSVKEGKEKDRYRVVKKVFKIDCGCETTIIIRSMQTNKIYQIISKT